MRLIEGKKDCQKQELSLYTKISAVKLFIK